MTSVSRVPTTLGLVSVSGLTFIVLRCPFCNDRHGHGNTSSETLSTRVRLADCGKGRVYRVALVLAHEVPATLLRRLRKSKRERRS